MRASIIILFLLLAQNIYCQEKINERANTFLEIVTYGHIGYQESYYQVSQDTIYFHFINKEEAVPDITITALLERWETFIKDAVCDSSHEIVKMIFKGSMQQKVRFIDAHNHLKMVSPDERLILLEQALYSIPEFNVTRNPIFCTVGMTPLSKKCIKKWGKNIHKCMKDYVYGRKVKLLLYLTDNVHNKEYQKEYN